MGLWPSGALDPSFLPSFFFTFSPLHPAGQAVSAADTIPNRHLEQERIYRNLETCKNVAGVTLSAHHSPERDIEAECGKVDIFVRTSDVRRLSDFQMWQVSPLGINHGRRGGYVVRLESERVS